MLDFPSPATTGQLYVAGSSVWRFDSAKWVPISNAASFPDAPSDGHTYGRNNAAWSSVDAQIAPATQMAQDNVGRNLAQNAQFNVYQRGTGVFSTNGAYTADRWLMGLASDTASVTLQALADADRTGIGDDAAVVTLQNAFTGIAGGSTNIGQRVESVRRLSGKAVTLSFWAKASTGTPRLGVGWFQYFGTGGSPSANVTGNLGTTPALSTSWARYSVTGTIPTSVGKTLGSTAGTDWTEFEIWYSAGSGDARAGGIGVQSGTVQLYGIQLEYGSVATALDKGGTPQQQLAECQRFYQVGNFQGLYYSVAGGAATWIQPYPVTMRAQPTITTSGVTYSNASALTVSMWGVFGAAFNFTVTAAGTGTAYGGYQASADL